MRARAYLLALLVANTAQAARVGTDNYHQFWLWGRVRPQPALDHATDVYVLQGEIGHVGERITLRHQGATPTRFPVDRVWLVYRVSSLDWTPQITTALCNQWRYWQTTGTHLAGIQLDFDARTRHLDEYADFLRRIRKDIPPAARLSITGLLDWTRTGDTATLNGLGGTVDEIIIQTYRGRHTIPDYANYLSSLSALTLPFKIGLVQGGDWETDWQARLTENPRYRGEVVFLLNSASQKMSRIPER